ncbi:hypothetical protein C7Y66_10960 [Chroococcidiopsis sp. CCALA 051]|uniref:hypothetical protein n=1 Tax=Chroococcidiopsis sp. CCALA 051 TaxID=869949 RepID=UPI000D0DB148|nr:hypothetical protein [Chroococcidiopsis sp. CCALA 051]MBE9015833.1 hypothetical protein [Chroococcidiopsidales cyanobacterium LEGE 13417]PSM49133.1 hypothetical protein C7Y66_10960 [Chroococcidiopsis sp. CCALA 051]
MSYLTLINQKKFALIKTFQAIFILFLLLFSFVINSPANAASGIDKLLELKGYSKTEKFDVYDTSSYPDYENPHHDYVERGDGDIKVIPIDLEQGISYVFLGSIAYTYTDSCYNMELSLLDDRGELISESEGYSKTPMLQVSAQKTGRYNLVAATPNHSSNTTSCGFNIDEYSNQTES